MTEEKKRDRELLQQALDNFPRLVAEKKKRAAERKKFLKETFGDLMRELEQRKKRMAAQKKIIGYGTTVP